MMYGLLSSYDRRAQSLADRSARYDSLPSP
jgi:hypothetical protein